MSISYLYILVALHVRTYGARWRRAPSAARALVLDCHYLCFSLSQSSLSRDASSSLCSISSTLCKFSLSLSALSSPVHSLSLSRRLSVPLSLSLRFFKRIEHLLLHSLFFLLFICILHFNY